MGGQNSVINTLKLFFDITLARRGPEDLPTAPRLLLVVTALYLLIFAALVTVLGAPKINWLGQLLASTLFSLAWMRLLLTLGSKPERFWQTATASTAISLFTLPLSVPLQLQLLRMMEAARKTHQESIPVDGSAVILLLAVPIMLWVAYAQARVIRAALEIQLFQAVLLVIAGAVFESLLLGILFAPPAAAG